MKTREEILNRKLEHYGQTLAAVEFAMREHAEEMSVTFLKWIISNQINLEGNLTIEEMLNQFKVNFNI